MPKRVDIPFPFGGMDTSSSPLRQSKGTGRLVRNALPRDWRANGIRRGAQRPGLTKFVDEQPCGDNPFQALAVVEVVAATGQSTLGSSVVTDTMVRGDTSAGSLGDFDTGGDDYSIAVSSTGKTSATVAVDDFSWSAAYAAGDAAKIASNKCVDNQNATSSSAAQVSVCHFLPTNTTEPTDNYSARLTFTTPSSFASTDCMIGLFCKANYTYSTGTGVDGAFWIGLAINASGTAAVNYGYNSTASVSAKEWRDGAHYKQSTASSTANPAKPSYTNTGNYPYSGSIANSNDAVVLSPSTTYLLEIRVSGLRVELLLNSLSWMTFSNIAVGSDGTTTPVDSTRTQYGFFFFNVGSGGRSGAASIDKFEVLNISVSDAEAATRIITANGGDVCHGGRSGGFDTASSGSAVYSDSATLFAFAGLGSTSAGARNFVYILDGANYKKVLVTASSATVATWAASGGLGSLPQGSTDSARKARYGLVWRNRIVLYGVDTNPDNWYMSRVGNPDDWLYTSSTDPARRAVAGDTSDTGLLPVPITCMAAFEADRMIVAGANRLWAMIGDPMLGGQFFAVSDRIGIVGPRAFTRDPMGNAYICYFDGIYMIPRGTLNPRPLSPGKMDRFFDNIDYNNVRVEMAWSRYMDGLHVFIIPTDGTAGQHLFWDAQDRAWSVFTMPENCGPATIAVYNDLDSMNDRGGDVVLIGGQDGYIRQFDADADDDDGTAIDSRVDFAPLVADGHLMPSLDSLEPIFGGNSQAAVMQVARSRSPEALDEAAAAVSRRFDGGGRRAPWPLRSTATAMGVRIVGTPKKYWSIEGVAGEVSGSGQFGRVT